jgi:hypothetical protein
MGDNSSLLPIKNGHGNHHHHTPKMKEDCCPWERRKHLALGVASGLALPVLFPLGHMLLFRFLWGDLMFPVDKLKCNNSCWDALFKGHYSGNAYMQTVILCNSNLGIFLWYHITGPYETGVARFKHVYFNATTNTLKMWIITVFGVIFFYETFKHVTLLALKRRLRM